MRIYQIAQAAQRHVFSLAAVGGGDKSINDQAYAIIMQDYVAKHVVGTPEVPIYDNFSFNIDYIDLNRGRDFLEESGTYDLVALLNVFNPDEEDEDDYSTQRGDYRLSTSHSSEEWVRRLASTGAGYIFVFGSQSGFSISGDYLGSIPGYQIHIEQRGFLTVYYK